ncbi:MAG: hypothetical protein ACE5OQ_01410 [Woeseia sp.]
MNKTNILVGAIVAGAISVACMAQEEEEEQDEPIAFTYATYHYCKLSGQSRADEIAAETNAPVYDALVEEGVISGWGWLAHHTGGKWRRVSYFQNESVDGLMDALDTIQERFSALDGPNEIADICYAHDDYIWTVELASQEPGEGRAEAGLSVYYVCNESKEERADELFESTFAPLFDKAIADGKIVTWGWSAHFIGGKYRRLQTMTGADHKSVLGARGDVLEVLYGGDEPDPAAVEFTDICGSHSDYLWDIQLEMP